MIRFAKRRLPFFAYFAVMSFLVSAHAAAQPTNTPTNLQSLCPSVSLTGPNRVLRGSPVKVVAVIEGETKKDSVKYEWDVSAGSIAAGQGTQELVVDTGELNVDEEEDVTIKVTLRLSGSARECAKTVFHTVTVGGQLAPAILVDRYNHIKESDEKARLDNFAIMLQNQPQCSGHVLVYQRTRPETRTGIDNP